MQNTTKRNEGLEVPQNKLIQRRKKEGRVKPNKDSRQTSSHNWDLLLHYFSIQLEQLCSKCFCLKSWINDARYDSKRCNSKLIKYFKAKNVICHLKWDLISTPFVSSLTLLNSQKTLNENSSLFFYFAFCFYSTNSLEKLNHLMKYRFYILVFNIYVWVCLLVCL